MNEFDWNDFFKRGYLSIPAKEYFQSELTHLVSESVPILCKNEKQLYQFKKVLDLRQSFYINQEFPVNQDFFKLYEDCLLFSGKLIQSFLQVTNQNPDLAGSMLSHQKSFLRPTLYHSHEVGSLLSEEHIDTSLFTLIIGGTQDGLQVLDQLEKKYVDIATNHEVVIVKFGSIMEAWTNGKVKATHHRVIAKKSSPRISLPFFFHPSPQCPMNDKYQTFGSYYRFKAKEAMLLGSD